MRTEVINTTEEASKKAVEWCKNHYGWKRICDIENVDLLFTQWDELSNSEKECFDNNIDYWVEFGRKFCKVPYGYITASGEFIRNIHLRGDYNIMTVFKVNESITVKRIEKMIQRPITEVDEIGFVCGTFKNGEMINHSNPYLFVRMDNFFEFQPNKSQTKPYYRCCRFYVAIPINIYFVVDIVVMCGNGAF